MKKLYFIGGTMGVGKTSVCQELKQRLPNSVFLDGDWCWDSHPFQVNEETKKMVMKNICFLLNQFLNSSVYENIIFCWVMHKQSIIDDILENICKDNCEIKVISLMCNENTLYERLEHDIQNNTRTKDVLERSIKRIPLYNNIDSIKVITDNLSIDDVVKKIVRL